MDTKSLHRYKDLWLAVSKNIKTGLWYILISDSPSLHDCKIGAFCMGYTLKQAINRFNKHYY